MQQSACHAGAGAAGAGLHRLALVGQHQASKPCCSALHPPVDHPADQVPQVACSMSLRMFKNYLRIKQVTFRQRLIAPRVAVCRRCCSRALTHWHPCVTGSAAGSQLACCLGHPASGMASQAPGAHAAGDGATCLGPGQLTCKSPLSRSSLHLATLLGLFSPPTTALPEPLGRQMPMKGGKAGLTSSMLGGTAACCCRSGCLMWILVVDRNEHGDV